MGFASWFLYGLYEGTTLWLYVYILHIIISLNIDMEAMANRQHMVDMMSYL